MVMPTDIGGTILGVPTIGILVVGGLFGGTLTLACSKGKALMERDFTYAASLLSALARCTPQP